MNITTVPPSDIDAENMILSILLQSPDDWEKVMEEGLVKEDFYSTRNRIIFDAMLVLTKRQIQIDIVTLVGHLEATKQLEGERLNLVSSLVAQYAPYIGVVNYVRTIKDKARRRKLIALGARMMELGYQHDLEWEDIKEEVENEITNLIVGEESRGAKSIADVLPKILDEISSGQTSASPTKLASLDWTLNGGLRQKELVVIAGRAAMGKTFVGNYLALNAAKQDKPVLMFSAEMDDLAIGKRLLGTVADIETSKLIANTIEEEELEQLYDGYANLSELPLWIDDKAGGKLTLQYIRSQCAKVKRKVGRIHTIVVDYLQLLGDRTQANRAAEVGKYSAGLKEIAKDFNVCVIALAQINREVEGQKDKRPSMAQIKDSGAIEQDADLIITLYRDEYYNPETMDKNILELGVVKNRSGATGLTKVEFYPSTGTIRDVKVKSAYF